MNKYTRMLCDYELNPTNVGDETKVSYCIVGT